MEKICIVNQSHFTEDGDYHTYYKNSEGNQSILFEVNTIKVTLKTSSERTSDSESKPESETESETSLIGIIVGSVIGGIIIIALIIFLVYRFKIKKREDNSDKKSEPLKIDVELK